MQTTDYPETILEQVRRATSHYTDPRKLTSNQVRKKAMRLPNGIRFLVALIRDGNKDWLFASFHATTEYQEHHTPANFLTDIDSAIATFWPGVVLVETERVQRPTSVHLKLLLPSRKHLTSCQPNAT